MTERNARKTKGYCTVYPKRPFLIYPAKYNDLFWLLPICFVLFFLKGGGWAYSIVLLVVWSIIAIHWTKITWAKDCEAKGQYKLFYNGEWINKPVEPTDFHEDLPTHELDELHYVYRAKEKRWVSHEELKKETEEAIKRDPKGRDLYETCLKKMEESHEDQKWRGF